MAGNNAIQFLRGTSTQRKKSNEVLLAGQPFFETNTNELFVGNGSNTPLSNMEPINPHRYYFTTDSTEVIQSDNGNPHAGYDPPYIPLPSNGERVCFFSVHFLREENANCKLTLILTDDNYNQIGGDIPLDLSHHGRKSEVKSFVVVLRHEGGGTFTLWHNLIPQDDVDNNKVVIQNTYSATRMYITATVEDASDVIVLSYEPTIKTRY